MEIRKSKLYIILANSFWNFLKIIIVLYSRIRLKNKSFSIIANDCVCGFVYQKFNYRYSTPTVWVRIATNDCLLLANNLNIYIDADLYDCKCNRGHAVGLLKPKEAIHQNILLEFVHECNFEIAKKQWESRKKRINYNNIFVIIDGTDDCINTMEEVNLFNSIPYKKIYLYKKEDSKYTEFIDDKFEIDFGEKHYDFQICKYVPGKIGTRLGKRFLDEYDYIGWLNSGMKNI